MKKSTSLSFDSSKSRDRDKQPTITDDSDGISSDEEDYLYYGKERKQRDKRENQSRTNYGGITPDDLNISADNSKIPVNPKGNYHLHD